MGHISSRPRHIEPGKTYVEKFDLILAAEKEAISRHRDGAPNAENAAGWCGVALSGGGIRSAIFCLGALQALAERHVLEKFDYMSSVSGGGYMASALQWWWHTDRESGTSSTNFPFGVGRGGGDLIPDKRLAYLKTHGEYLTPDARMSLWSATAVVIRTLFLNLAVWIPVGACLFFWLIVVFRCLASKISLAWIPNFYSFLAGSRWRDDCPGHCAGRWNSFSESPLWALLIIAFFALGAIALSFDTKISPKQKTAAEKQKTAPEGVKGIYFAGALVSFAIAAIVTYFSVFGVKQPTLMRLSAGMFVATAFAVGALWLVLWGRGATAFGKLSLAAK